MPQILEKVNEKIDKFKERQPDALWLFEDVRATT